MKIKLLLLALSILSLFRLQAQSGNQPPSSTSENSQQQNGYIQQAIDENPPLNSSTSQTTNPKKGAKSPQTIAQPTPTNTVTPPNSNPNAPPPQNAVSIPNMPATYPQQTLPQQNVNPVITPQQQAPKTTTTTTPSGAQSSTAISPLLDTSRYMDTTKLPKSTIYGHDIFRNKNLALFNRSLDAQAMGNYIIGVGDQLGINVWGYSSYSGSYAVDQTGAIFPQGVGKIFVKGLTFDKAQAAIRARFAQYLNMANSQIEVTLIYARNITVNLVGEVFQPGSYTLPATNTLFNALLAANGPTDLGSVRQIFLKRDGQTVHTFDVYNFLLNPSSANDFFLQNNDYIFVPAAQKIVSISGEVQRPMKYELIDGEDLNNLLTYSGGLTAKAYTKSVQVKRFVSGQLRLIDLNLDSLMKSQGHYELMNGDEVIVNSLPSQLFQYVKVNGAVMQPGQYNFTGGMHVSDVLNKAHGLRDDAINDRAYIIRQNPDLTTSYIQFNPSEILRNPRSPDNLEVKNLDEIFFFDRQKFIDSLTVSVQGAVRIPGKFAYAKGMTVNDLLIEAGGLKRESANTKVEVTRYQTENGQVIPMPQVIKSIPISDSSTIDLTEGKFGLLPYDVVYVRSLSIDTQHMITIRGEVVYPGAYSMTDKEERLSDLIKQSGGLTKWANTKMATLTRAEDNRGIVFMHLDKVMEDEDSRYNLYLRPGDVINIPTANDIVTISGAVNYPFKDTTGLINGPFRGEKRAKYYVKHYGLGFNKESWRQHTYVIQPGQQIEDPRHWGFIQIYPKVQSGAYVVVPKKPVKVEPANAQPSPPIDWNQIIESAMVKITGLLTLYVLISRINF